MALSVSRIEEPVVEGDVRRRVPLREYVARYAATDFALPYLVRERDNVNVARSALEGAVDRFVERLAVDAKTVVGSIHIFRLKAAVFVAPEAEFLVAGRSRSGQRGDRKKYCGGYYYFQKSHIK
jgi:hypothetical protein